MKKLMLGLGCFLLIGLMNVATKGQEGCSNYLGRAGQKMCTTKTGYDQCVALLKQGKMDLCVYNADANSWIRRATPAEASADLIKKGCKDLGNNVFQCYEKTDYTYCVGYKNFGAIADCKLKELPIASLTISNDAGGELQAWESSRQTSSKQLNFKLTSPVKDALKIVWQMSNTPFSQPKNDTDWQTPAVLISSGTVAPTKGEIIFSINTLSVLGQPSEKLRRLYIRALFLKNDALVASASNNVTIDYGIYKADIKFVIPVDNSPKTPAVSSSVSIVGYHPPLLPEQDDPYAFILTKTPPSSELKLVLEKLNARNPGDKFHLSPYEYEKIVQNFSLTEKAKLELQGFLQTLKKGYNWLDSKYNYIENKLVDNLATLVSREKARKAINYYKSLYGGIPSYGDFDEALDIGKDALKQKLITEAAAELTDGQQQELGAKVDEFIAEVKKQANGGDDPNQFYRRNPAFVSRPAVVVLRVKYNSVNNPPAGMVGGNYKTTISMMSGKSVDASSLTTTGNLTYPALLLFEKATEIPAGKVGTVINIPVYIDYAPSYQKDGFLWKRGYQTLDNATIQIGGAAVKVVASKKFP